MCSVCKTIYIQTLQTPCIVFHLRFTLPIRREITTKLKTNCYSRLQPLCLLASLHLLCTLIPRPPLTHNNAYILWFLTKLRLHSFRNKFVSFFYRFSSIFRCYLEWFAYTNEADPTTLCCHFTFTVHLTLSPICYVNAKKIQLFVSYCFTYLSNIISIQNSHRTGNLKQQPAYIIVFRTPRQISWGAIGNLPVSLCANQLWSHHKSAK